MKASGTPLAAVYCRYSKDDGKTSDSSSIQTQKEMLSKYVVAQGFDLYRIYCDDGFSGLNSERPDFKAMIADAKSGKFSVIVTKDLSRLSRNHIETDMYIEMLFPQMGIRYISINDSIDTENNIGLDIAPFKSILNEMYSRDISKKISSARRTRLNQGLFMGTTVPIGYMKNPDNKNQLLIDERHAPIVRRIFALAKDGYGIGRIRQIMTKDKIPRPGTVTFAGMATYELFFDDDHAENRTKWSNNSVRGILRNPVYAGHLAGYKRVKTSFKSTHRKSKLPEDWIVIKNTHEPIIPPEEFELVQNLITSRRRTGKSGYDNIFAGLIKCADCGYAMSARHTNRTKKPEPIQNMAYTCNNYATFGKAVSGCTGHSMDALDVYNTVLADINKQAECAYNDNYINDIIAKTSEIRNKEFNALKKELKQHNSRLGVLDALFVKLYEDNASGKVNDYNYKKLSDKYESEQSALTTRISEITKILNAESDKRLNAELFISEIKKYTHLTTLNAEILNRLITKITVSEKYKDIDGETHQDITIYYKFIGKI
ncbi:recombinase [Clostridia bacterium]|nr:recombinase [Clostridia bacterium]